MISPSVMSVGESRALSLFGTLASSFAAPGALSQMAVSGKASVQWYLRVNLLTWTRSSELPRLTMQ